MKNAYLLVRKQLGQYDTDNNCTAPKPLAPLDRIGKVGAWLESDANPKPMLWRFVVLVVALCCIYAYEVVRGWFR